MSRDPLTPQQREEMRQTIAHVYAFEGDTVVLAASEVLALLDESDRLAAHANIVDCGSLLCPFEAQAKAAESRLTALRQWIMVRSTAYPAAEYFDVLEEFDRLATADVLGTRRSDPLSHGC